MPDFFNCTKFCIVENSFSNKRSKKVSLVTLKFLCEKIEIINVKVLLNSVFILIVNGVQNGHGKQSV